MRITSSCIPLRRKLEQRQDADLLALLDDPTLENFIRAGRFRRRILAAALDIDISNDAFDRQRFIHLNDEEQSRFLLEMLPDVLVREMELAVKDVARKDYT